MTDSGGEKTAAKPVLSSDQERAASLIERLGLPPGSIREELALEALRHGSWLHERKPPVSLLRSNERLEFLGDSVLGLLISQRCHDRFPDSAEGDLTRARAALVKAESLASIARAINLGELLLLGRGEERSGGRDKQNLLADALEAAVAAVYLSSGIEAAGIAVDHLFTPLFEQAAKGVIGRDYKTELQEMLQSVHRVAPSYTVTAAPGPQHARTFEVQVHFLGAVLGQGSGRTKKDAEQSAARAALDKSDETAALAKTTADAAFAKGAADAALAKETADAAQAKEAAEATTPATLSDGPEQRAEEAGGAQVSARAPDATGETDQS